MYGVCYGYLLFKVYLLSLFLGFVVNLLPFTLFQCLDHHRIVFVICIGTFIPPSVSSSLFSSWLGEDGLRLNYAFFSKEFALSLLRVEGLCSPPNSLSHFLLLSFFCAFKSLISCSCSLACLLGYCLSLIVFGTSIAGGSSSILFIAKYTIRVTPSM